MFPFYGFVPIGRRFTIDTASEKINTAHFSYIYIAKIAEEVRTNTWRVVLNLVASWFNTMGCHWGVQREHKVTCLTCSLRSLRPVWGCSLRSLRPVPLCSLRSMRPATFWWVSRKHNFYLKFALVYKILNIKWNGPTGKEISSLLAVCVVNKLMLLQFFNIKTSSLYIYQFHEFLIPGPVDLQNRPKYRWDG